jgi:DNA-binding transcriptional LysR family regulator
LAPFLGQFIAQQPRAEVTLVEGSLTRLSDLLCDSAIDAAVVAYVGRPDKRLRYHSLYRERIVAVSPKGHRFEHLDSVPLGDLRDENFLFRTNCDMGDFLLASCRRQGFEPRIVLRSAQEDWVQSIVASGFGITVMPEFTHTNNFATVARPIVNPDLVRQLSLVTVPGRRHAQAAACFLRAIRAQPWSANNQDSRSPHALMAFNNEFTPAAEEEPP